MKMRNDKIWTQVRHQYDPVANSDLHMRYHWETNLTHNVRMNRKQSAICIDHDFIFTPRYGIKCIDQLLDKLSYSQEIRTPSWTCNKHYLTLLIFASKAQIIELQSSAFSKTQRTFSPTEMVTVHCIDHSDQPMTVSD